MTQISLVAATLFSMTALIVPSSFAADCGKTVSSKRLEEHTQTLVAAANRITDHSRSISEDVGRRLANASTQTANEIDRMNFQVTILDSVRTNADLVQEILIASNAMTQMRDSMLDARDKQTISRYVSLYLLRLKNVARINEAATGRSLRLITAPGIAIDVASVRDQFAKMADEYQGCDSPLGPQRR